MSKAWFSQLGDYGQMTEVSEPQFSLLYNGDNSNPYLAGGGKNSVS